MSKSNKRHLKNQANNNTSSSRANKQRATVNANHTARESNEEATLDTRSMAAPTKTITEGNKEAADTTRGTRTRKIIQISHGINIRKTTKMANVLTSENLGVAATRTEVGTEAADVLLRITTIAVKSTSSQRLTMSRTTVCTTLRTLIFSLK